MEILRLFVLKLRKEKSRISKFFEFKSRGMEQKKLSNPRDYFEKFWKESKTQRELLKIAKTWPVFQNEFPILIHQIFDRFIYRIEVKL